MSDPLSRISERLGLPVLGLVALAGLALLALLLGLMWLVTRLRARPSAKSLDSELYAVEDGARGRRELPSGVMARRETARESKSTEVGKIATPSAAAAAAAIISGDEAEQSREKDAQAANEIPFQSAKTESTKTEDGQSKEAPVDTDATDPSSWRRPNLERLKASIREDWVGEKEEQAVKTAGATTAVTSATPKEAMPSQAAAIEATNTEAAGTEATPSPFRREAENFASLFGDDDPAPAADEEVETFFSAGLGTPKGDDRAKFSDLRSAVEKTADITPREALEQRRAELPTREDAMRRIRALRESVKAS